MLGNRKTQERSKNVEDAGKRISKKANTSKDLVAKKHHTAQIGETQESKTHRIKGGRIVLKPCVKLIRRLMRKIERHMG
ncbi:hypothetical protein BofuT4_uP030640.1 [Botrytis cinerea T4]|uniref:Uncharacterized protein n=1 Tax=Botryotinia fuckeliana (strain T4) TaxID=999810 RepID=G2Y9B2_BOTF4|nr:hypothetical protein BofuT4_uP030640.1 [Botrytis cinerea T4]